MFRRLVIAACLLVLGGTAHADDPVATYAIVVGDNAGGPGQTDLHYAEDDARRVAELLIELGGYSAAHVDVVVHPTPAQLREHVALLSQRVQADVAAGHQARVFFYYSGHARAQAIDLGADELPLVELRQRLFEIPATLTIVVLDACQSGAFSRIKGAAPAADFSYSSRQHLDAAGIAVLASSSGSELSQESEQLHSSYFTHHLLVGLRGAGDTNGDGEVTIDEAYRYAYHQTLLATTETAIGGQHVTFEAALRGHGDVPLSFPRAASAAVVLPPALSGKALLADRRSHTVVAETYKAKGAAVRIAVAPGDYEVLVRDGDTLQRCEVTAPGVVDLTRCHSENVIASTAKGGDADDSHPMFKRPWRIELGGNVGSVRGDGYTQNLANFGYVQDGFATGSELSLTVQHRLLKYWAFGVQVAHMSLPRWTHPITGEGDLMQTLTSSANAFNGVISQRLMGFFDDRLGIFYEGTVGIGQGVSNLEDTSGMTHHQTNYGVTLGAVLGLYYETSIGLGISAGYALEDWRVIKDLVGNTHDVGGNRLVGSLSYSF